MIYEGIGKELVQPTRRRQRRCWGKSVRGGGLTTSRWDVSPEVSKFGRKFLPQARY